MRYMCLVSLDKVSITVRYYLSLWTPLKYGHTSNIDNLLSPTCGKTIPEIMAVMCVPMVSTVKRFHFVCNELTHTLLCIPYIRYISTHKNLLFNNLKFRICGHV